MKRSCFYVAFMLSAILSGCSASAQKIEKTAADIAGVACTTTSIILHSVELGTICTDANEIKNAIIALVGNKLGGDVVIDDEQLAKKIMEIRAIKATSRK